MSRVEWISLLGPLMAGVSVIVAIWISNRNLAAQHKSESDRLDKAMGERMAILETKVTAWSERVSTFERHIQTQINDLKLRLTEIEREMKREKSKP